MILFHRSTKHNNGFSLIELIIVIAIMVALVAVLAPQFGRYVKRANDAVIADIAEEALTVAKVEFIEGNLAFASGVSSGTITVGVPDGDGEVRIIVGDDLTYNGNFEETCGLSTNKKVNSTRSFEITISGDTLRPSFTLTETTP